MNTNVEAEIVEPSNAVALRPSMSVGQAMRVEDILQQVQLVQQVMKKVMKEGEHYGTIPGCGDKKCLLQPGAQKLTMTFRLTPEYEIQEVNLERGHKEYRVICTLRSMGSGNLVGQGVGCCSSMESKYRFRGGARKCPECGKETIIKGKAQFGGGWLCWEKKGGCGAKWPDGAEEIESQSIEKVENDNPADTFNTVLKMAKKRAFVDATITATAASDIFTQDLEENEAQEAGNATQNELKAETGSNTTPAKSKRPISQNKAKSDTQVSPVEQSKADLEAVLGVLKAKLGADETEFVRFLRNENYGERSLLLPNEDLSALSLQDARDLVNNFSKVVHEMLEKGYGPKGTPPEGRQFQKSDNDLDQDDLPYSHEAEDKRPFEIGEVASVTTKEGTSNKGVWKLFRVTINGHSMTTFDRTVGETAQKLWKKNAKAWFKVEPKGDALIEIQAA